MDHENFIIEIDGSEAADIYPDLIGLEVELDDEIAGMFRLQLSMLQEPEGVWRYLDEERFRVWKPVLIRAGFEGGNEELISGYITHVKPIFEPDPSQCALEIWGMDASVLMGREEKLKDWPDKKDSDIASEIFSLYGLTPGVEDTEVIHDEAVSTVIQRETDIQFLKRLALRNGFECYVEGTTGYFRPPQVDASLQPVLAVHFGAESNVNHLSLEVNAVAPADVAMFQIDRVNKEILEARVDSSQQTALGDIDAVGLLAAGMNPGQIYIAMNATTGNPEMTSLCQGLFHQAEWFVSGEGEIAANRYGHVLKPRGTVPIKGIGGTYSGVYYVTHVTHVFSADGYAQVFRIKRNAIMPTGTEDFAASSDGLI